MIESEKKNIYILYMQVWKMRIFKFKGSKMTAMIFVEEEEEEKHDEQIYFCLV